MSESVSLKGRSFGQSQDSMSVCLSVPILWLEVEGNVESLEVVDVLSLQKRQDIAR